MNALATVGYFLFTLIFSLAIFMLWMRIGLRFYRISALHPFAQVIYRLTNPIVEPVQQILPTQAKRMGRYDLACFIVLIAIELLKFTLITLIFVPALFSFGYILLYTLADLIIQPCNLLFYAVLIRVIMSWINPQWRHPVAEILYQLTEPLLRAGRKIVPDISGFDFSPFVIAILLKVIVLFIGSSLPIYLS